MYQKNPRGEWYSIANIDKTDSPALVLYKERITGNIQRVKEMVTGVQWLRPHVKTNKTPEVCRMMLDAGITKFKCATIAEAEMLAQLEAPDVLMAYQPVGPKLLRFINLIKAYPAVQFSCLADSITHAATIDAEAQKNGVIIRLFIDLNIGMNRTGIKPEAAFELAAYIHGQKNIRLYGLHGYDGHIRVSDTTLRKEQADQGFDAVSHLENKIQQELNTSLTIVLGGTPTFPMHARRENVECSPGTFVFNDWGYKHALPDEPFEYAALLITRVISIVDQHTICTDLGHKSVAAENPLQDRVRFLNAPDVVFKGQSEEHLVLTVENTEEYSIGDVLYGVPIHICPTVALYDRAQVVENNSITGSWKIIARNRSVNI
ncbi:MAG: D-TA family PLP-dependent enzyme [Chitinophagaceae bacterium]|nr:D-TA family PLP-dependent enzyme [Chitinophagaceae bacterium]MCW5926581.1 D-TA family PLP-dependent enzyme [Chitinophagaceae bacterium]